MNRAACEALDAADPLASRRQLFSLPESLLYLDGNSLGALPHAVPARMQAVVSQQWGTDLIRSWNCHRWIDLPERVGARIAPLIGAAAHEVLAADTVSVNIFKLLAAALALRPGRRTIVSEAGNFPTDLYIMQGLAAMMPDVTLRVVARTTLAEALDDTVAVLLLTGVHFKTGARFDMQAMTAAAHRAGALMLWDLSHSTGAVAVDLNGTGADLAVGCGYKFLNGGPGAPAFLFVASRHLEHITNPLSGWLGHAAPFDFIDAYAPATGIRRMLCSSPSILALSALDAALEAWDGIDPAAIEHKAGALGDVFITLVTRFAARHGLHLVSPLAARERGAQVSFAHRSGYAIVQALIAQGVIGDFRAPDLMRFGFAPLTTRFVDVFDAAAALESCLDAGTWRDPRFGARAAVT